MSRFPKISETFILYEMVAIEELGIGIEVFPLVKEREAVAHPEAARFTHRAHNTRLFSRDVLAAQLYWLRHGRGRYLSAWWDALKGNLGSPRFLVRALAVVPLAATFARRMMALNISHIHAHWATHPALAAYVASHLTGIPYSFTAHAHDIYVDRPMLRKKIERAEFVVTISEFNRRFLERLYGGVARDRLVVIHCGTDPEKFQPPPDGRGSRTFTIACVASLQPQKGQRHLIEACRLLAVGGLDVQCVLVGDGETRAELEEQIHASGLSSRVSLLGQQPRERVVEILAAADAVAQPSVVLRSGKMEGIPVALMEALAMERPVVATDISGVAELIRHEVTGLLVAPGDAEQLAAALKRIHDDPAFGASLGRSGRDLVVRDFDLNRSARVLASRFAAAMDTGAAAGEARAARILYP